MTPEPRDLTERRVEAIARVLCGDKLGDANAKDVNGQPRWKWFVPLAQRIIAADPATARITELKQQINELELKWEWELGRRQYWQTEAGKEFERAKSATALLAEAEKVIENARWLVDSEAVHATMTVFLAKLREAGHAKDL